MEPSIHLTEETFQPNVEMVKNNSNLRYHLYGDSGMMASFVKLLHVQKPEVVFVVHGMMPEMFTRLKVLIPLVERHEQ
jgi:hypothetical protein